MCFLIMLVASLYDGRITNWIGTILYGVVVVIYWVKFVRPKKKRTRFTWWTYWVAIRRARVDMDRAFGKYYTGLGSPDEYTKKLAFVEAVRTRRMEKLYERLFSAPYYS